MNRTKIEYLDYTWNPTHGCSPVSEGCANCWAKTMSKRLAAMGARGYDPKDPFKPTMCPWALNEPLKVRKPSIIGVSFMGDLFHEKIPDDFITDVWTAMGEFYDLNDEIQPVENRPGHTYLVLTKRIERASSYLSIRYPKNFARNNVWVGFTAENQKCFEERIFFLFHIFCPIRFVSLEPLLGPIDFQGRLWSEGAEKPHIDWVIAGCESGSKRRPSNIDDFRSLRDQCQEAGVPFFLKQMEVDGKIIHMPELDGKVWDQMPGGSSRLKAQS